MIKKVIALNLLLILVYGCGFTPIYSTKNETFSIQNTSLAGDKDINKIIKKRLKNFTKNVNANRFFDIAILSSNKRNVTAKNKRKSNSIFS